MSIRIAHLADLHLGFNAFTLRTPEGQNRREADFEAAALAAVELITNELKPDVVVVAGDALHDTRVSTRGISGAIVLCQRLAAAGLSPLVIGGNHDHADGERSFSMLELLRHAGADVHLEQATVERAGTRLHLVPFRSLARAARGRGELAPFEFATDKPNLLVAHAACEAPGIVPEEVMVPSDWLGDPRFRLCMLGHIHRRQQVAERAFYPGATERLNYGEREYTPGFLLHELADDGSLATRELDTESFAGPHLPRRMLSEAIDAGEITLEQLDARARGFLAGDVEGALARLTVTNVPALFLRSRLRHDWQEAFTAAGGLHLDVVAHSRRVSELLDIEFTKPPVDLPSAFGEFLSEQELAADEREQIAALAAEVIAAAREKMIGQES